MKSLFYLWPHQGSFKSSTTGTWILNCLLVGVLKIEGCLIILNLVSHFSDFRQNLWLVYISLSWHTKIIWNVMWTYILSLLWLLLWQAAFIQSKDSQLGGDSPPLPQGDIWKCPKIFLVAKTGRGCNWHLEDRGQGYCQHSTMHSTAPHNKQLSKMSIVLSWKPLLLTIIIINDII